MKLKKNTKMESSIPDEISDQIVANASNAVALYLLDRINITNFGNNSVANINQIDSYVNITKSVPNLTNEMNFSNNNYDNGSFPRNPTNNLNISWIDKGLMRVIPLYSVIFLLAVIGNSLVILTLVQNKRMRTITNLFLLNLAVSDLFLGVVCMPFTLVGSILRDFVFGEIMCKLLPYLQGNLSINYGVFGGFSHFVCWIY